MRQKRFFLYAALLGLTVALLTLLGAGYLSVFHESPRLLTESAPYRLISRELSQSGPRPELGALLRQIPHPIGWKATIIVEHRDDSRYNIYTAPFLVADPPELGGYTTSSGITSTLVLRRGYKLTYGPPIPGPDGKAYTVAIFQNVRFRFALNGLMLIGAALSWLSLALWLFADARERRSASPAWFLLTLLTGPLGLAVWLIVRPSPHQEQAPTEEPQTPTEEPQAPGELCPGCGAGTVPGAAFCVRCGFALHPACPECRRPVEPDWAYCAACGTPQGE